LAVRFLRPFFLTSLRPRPDEPSFRFVSFLNGSPDLVLRFRPDGDVNWINVLSWSEWTVTAVGARSPPTLLLGDLAHPFRLADNGSIATASLALADGDGRVWTIEVSQELSGDEISVEASPALVVASNDGRGATQLYWLEKEGSVRPA
jgi:hypothetical protein